MSQLRFLRVLATALAVCLVSTVPALAAEEKEEQASEPVEYTPANTIDFGTELGLPFDSLRTLGSRIEQARRAPDPVGLASAARELAVAEKVSEETAGVTSDELLKQAVEMAKAHNISSELQAVAMLVSDDKAAKQLTALAEQAAKAEASASADETPRGFTGSLTVVNKTDQWVDVYVNFKKVMQVAPHTRLRRSGYNPSKLIILQGMGSKGGKWTRVLSKDLRDPVWTLYD